MNWSSLFLLSIAQGVFLISAIAYRGSKNSLASRLIITLLILMIFPNLGYLVIRTDLKNYVPQLFGLQFGLLFLFGPLFYLYSRSVIDSSFHWKSLYWLHFIPYFIYLLYVSPFILKDKWVWISFISTFLSGELPIHPFDKLFFAIQDLQHFIYLFFTFRCLKRAKNNSVQAQYIVPFSSRLKWVKQLSYGFALFLMTVFSLYIFILINGKYNPVTNYVYTLITSGIVYFIAYKLVLNPEPISPDFTPKYRAYMQFTGAEGEKYVQKLYSLMNQARVFLNPDLNLSGLAEQMQLPPHQVSKLINEKFDKSFNDFVNQYRVKEFLARINDPRYQAFTIYGLALDVGFNSKSSFNLAFKKITGKNPSEYKTSS